MKQDTPKNTPKSKTFSTFTRVISITHTYIIVELSIVARLARWISSRVLVIVALGIEQAISLCEKRIVNSVWESMGGITFLGDGSNVYISLPRLQFIKGVQHG